MRYIMFNSTSVSYETSGVVSELFAVVGDCLSLEIKLCSCIQSSLISSVEWNKFLVVYEQSLMYYLCPGIYKIWVSVLKRRKDYIQLDWDIALELFKKIIFNWTMLE